MAQTDPQYLITDLDKVLAFLAGPFGTAGIDFDQMLTMLWQKELMPMRPDQGVYLLRILEKLISDRYLMTWEWPHNEIINEATLEKVHTMYKATWNGIYFSQIGGYTQDIANKNRLTQLEMEIKKISKRTYWLTMTVTIVSILTVLLEIWKDFFKSKF